MGKRIVIIDGNSLINRAYYAMQRPMITKEGIYTQGIYGFLNMLSKIMDDYSPDYITVAWDRKAPTFRHEQYSEYKAGRKKMPPELAMEMPIMKDILTAMNIENLEIDGFEADDIIGTVARLGEEEGLEPLIITGDKDALQLATDITHVLITRKGISEFDLYDREKMIERYELTPEQFIDLKGLMGDQSDNIPGIPGVGEKTGIKLLKEFGSVAELLANTDKISNVKLKDKVEENAQLAAMSRRLAEINRYVPLDIDVNNFKTKEPDMDALVDIYSKLEFNSFLKKLDYNGAGSSNAIAEDETDYKKYRITDFDGLKTLNELADNSELTIKVFSDNNHVEMPIIDGIAMLNGDKYFYIVNDGKLDRELIEILNRKKFKFSGHDLIKDYYPLMMIGLEAADTSFDIAIAGYVIDPSKSNYDIKTLALEYLRTDIKTEKEMNEASGQTDLLGQSTAAFDEYGFEWCHACAQIAEFQKETIKKDETESICYETEFPLIEVLASMEVEGVYVDREMLKNTGVELSEQIDKLESAIYEACGEKFNINSPVQLGEILFDKLGLPAGKKTKRGYSTSADILEKLKEKHPVVALVLQYRTLTKLNSTYVEGLGHLIGSDDKIHAHFQQTVAATGRLSCTEPNLQNIPVRQEMGRQLRKAFVPGEGRTFTGADYSQIELRIMAHLSGDENLIAAFNSGEDIHRNTAARVFNLKYDEVKPIDRSRAKAVNFGVIYGMSSFGLSEELHISRKEAENYINEYFEKHQAVKNYLDDQVKLCKEKGYSTTILGRKRYIHEINSSNYMTRQFGERLAMNSPIQGSAADIIKIAMVNVFKELRERNLKSKLILQIHDELIISTTLDESEEVKELLVRNMENAIQLKVKLISDLNTGDSWYDLKD
jgi:DNA polymerase I